MPISPFPLDNIIRVPLDRLVLGNRLRGVISGGILVNSGISKREESRIHIDALAELGSSMEGEISSQVIELEERTVTLTGTVQGQYQQWRQILKEIYNSEVGELEKVPTDD